MYPLASVKKTIGPKAESFTKEKFTFLKNPAKFAKTYYYYYVKKVFLLLFFLSPYVKADTESCEYFKYCGDNASSSSSRRSKSNPSASSSASFNPSSISSYKGLGLETLIQANNPVAISVVSGTGKIGGALISPTVENSFFGNRSLELDEDFFWRSEKKKRYKNKKLNLAVGTNLLTKTNYSFDLGISIKRNPDIGKINPGVGFSAKVGFMNFGGYFYKDDVKLDISRYSSPYVGTSYSLIHGSESYQEQYNVQTYTVGLKFKMINLDMGIIKTKYKFYPEDTYIRIYSSAINIKRFLVNFAYRREDSPNLEIQDGSLIIKRKKHDIYYGLQFQAGKHLLLGIGHNTFLMNEWSGTVTIFI